MQATPARAWGWMRGAVAGYMIAIVGTLLATVIRAALDPTLGHLSQYTLYLFVVGAAAAVGGWRCGVLAMVLGLALGFHLFIYRPGRFHPVQISVQTTLYLLTATLLCLIAEWGRRKRDEAVHYGDHVRSLLHDMGDAYFLLDGEGCIVELNARAEAYCHRPRPQTLGYRLWDVIPNIEPIRAAFDRALATGQSLGLEARCEALHRWLDVQIFPTLGGVAIFARDITERRHAEEELRRSTSLLQTLSETTPDPLFAKDRESRMLWMNPATARVLGKPPEQLLGKHDFAWLPPAEAAAVQANDRRVMESGQTQVFEESIVGPEGQRIFLSTKSPLRDRSGKVVGLVGLARDITERKRFEEDLAVAKESAERARAQAEQYARQAEEASRAKDHFLAVLSHELRNPLTPVLATVSMLQRRPQLDENVQEALDMIRRNMDLETQLIDDLLDMTRIARGKIELDRVPIELCRIIERSIEVCRPDVEARGLHFGVDWGPRPYWVHADASRLQQVFWNLLRNAIKFTPGGGHVTVRCRPERGQVITEVIDTGIGIDPADRSRLFNAFEQAERSITRQFGGLGLGLTISKALVDLHEGRIEAHSEGRGKGATFRVILPMVQPAERSHRPQDATPAAPPVRPLRILLVEDHGDTMRIMRRLLSADGHDVEAAADVATALRVAEAGKFDLLISDLGLPDGSGLDLMRLLRSRGRTMPGIALSGYGQEQDIARSRDAGFAVHLVKPTTLERLQEAINLLTRPAPAGPNGDE